jgi:hypothetical protein
MNILICPQNDNFFTMFVNFLFVHGEASQIYLKEFDQD